MKKYPFYLILIFLSVTTLPADNLKDILVGGPWIQIRPSKIEKDITYYKTEIEFLFRVDDKVERSYTDFIGRDNWDATLYSVKNMTLRMYGSGYYVIKGENMLILIGAASLPGGLSGSSDIKFDDSAPMILIKKSNLKNYNIDKSRF